jgi:hypothetical protein
VCVWREAFETSIVVHCAASVDLLPNEAHKNINKKFFVDLLEAIGCYTFSLSLFLAFIINAASAEMNVQG